MHSERETLLKALGELVARYPQWRFGQLVANVAEWTDCSVWDIEDGAMLRAIRDHLDRVTAVKDQTSGVS